MKWIQAIATLLAIALMGLAGYVKGYKSGMEYMFDENKKFEDERNKELISGKLKCFRDPN